MDLTPTCIRVCWTTYVKLQGMALQVLTQTTGHKGIIKIWENTEKYWGTFCSEGFLLSIMLFLTRSDGVISQSRMWQKKKKTAQSWEMAIWREMWSPSMVIVIRHEFIYTWQPVPLEFNLSTLISQTDSLPSINSFVHKRNMHFFFFFASEVDGKTAFYEPLPLKS